MPHSFRSQHQRPGQPRSSGARFGLLASANANRPQRLALAPSGSLSTLRARRKIFLASNTFPTPLPASAHACTLTTASGARDGAPSPRATRRRCNHVLRRSPVFSSFVRGPIRAAAWSSQTARWSLAASAAARSRRFSLDLASSAASRREAQCLRPAVRGLASRHAVLCTFVVAGPKTRFFCPFRYAIYRNRNSVRKPCITHSRAMSA